MATEIGKDTKIKLSLETIISLGVVLVSMTGMWFTLKAEIDVAKTLPVPEITKIEYDLKDELIRQTIMDTQDDVDKILEELEKIDERLYEIQKNN